MTGRHCSGVLMLLLALVALAGCSAEGRIEVRSVAAIDVDLTVRGNRSPYCNGDINGLRVTPGTEPGGVVTSCRYRGTVDVTDLGYSVSLAAAGEYLVLVVNPFDVPLSGPRGTLGSELERVDVTIAFPGALVEHNGGTAAGRELRITEPEVLQLPGGLRAASLSHPGAPWWQWWAAGGLVTGMITGVGVVGLVRIARSRARMSPAQAGTEGPQMPLAPTAGAQREDASPDAPASSSTPAQHDADGGAGEASADPARWAPEP